jgi:hypothetical protein
MSQVLTTKATWKHVEMYCMGERVGKYGYADLPRESLHCGHVANSYAKGE